MKNIVTPMNFIRGSEPRLEMDLLGTTKSQLELTFKYGIKTTYLLQYDAFTKKEYQELFVKKSPIIEVGLWFELCQALIERVGLVWRGREGYDWDYYLNVDNLLGYEKEYRHKIIDEVFNEYKKVFKEYPKTVGSWLLDPESLEYMKEKYNIQCHCICREQWGTDGNTLFGGYYNQAYYPAKNNILCPSSRKYGVDVPTFRLLGCDPIYQYDSQLTSTCGDVFTLEPVYWIDDKTKKPSPIGGNNKEWIKWYFDSLYKKGYGQSFAYAQVGQENSFGWERIKDGLILQMEELMPLIKDGIVEPMFLSEAGIWFSENFDKSPVSTQVALCDYLNKSKKSIWYYSKNYRVNLYYDELGLRVRDMFKYDETYKSRYVDTLLTTHDALHDNLPIMNGLKWTKYPDYAGIYFVDKNGLKLNVIDIEYSEQNGTSVSLIKHSNGDIKVEFSENKVKLTSSKEFFLKYVYYQLLDDEKISVKSKKQVEFSKRDFKYSVVLHKGNIEKDMILSEDGEISVSF